MFGGIKSDMIQTASCDTVLNAQVTLMAHSLDTANISVD